MASSFSQNFCQMKSFLSLDNESISDASSPHSLSSESDRNVDAPCFSPTCGPTSLARSESGLVYFPHALLEDCSQRDSRCAHALRVRFLEEMRFPCDHVRPPTWHQLTHPPVFNLHRAATRSPRCSTRTAPSAPAGDSVRTRRASSTAPIIPSDACTRSCSGRRCSVPTSPCQTRSCRMPCGAI